MFLFAQTRLVKTQIVIQGFRLTMNSLTDDSLHSNSLMAAAPRPADGVHPAPSTVQSAPDSGVWRQRARHGA